MIFVIGWCVRRTRDADGREQVDSARGCPTATRIDVRDFIRRHTRQLARVTCVRIVVSLAGAITRRVAARTTRYGRARWAPPRFSVCTVRCSGARESSPTTTSESASASSAPPSRRALSRRGTLNRARDAEPRDVDARLLSRPSAGTPSVSFAMRFTRTRVWWVRTRRRRSPGPRRTSSSSSDRRRCTSSSAASSRASSTPSTAKREVRRSDAKRDAPNRR